MFSNSSANAIGAVRFVVFDFDGVFTDNTVYVSQEGMESVRCWRGDGLGLTALKEIGIDAVIVPMHEAQHAAFRWISRGAKVTRGYAIKLVDRPPLLLAYPMERDEAAASV